MRSCLTLCAMVLLETETRNKVHRWQREHVLIRSASGRRLIVVELQTRGEELEAFEVSGYLEAEAAERRLRELEAGECWLSEASRERMRQGESLRVEELEWASP